MNGIIDKILGTYTTGNKKRVENIVQAIKEEYASLSNLTLDDGEYFKNKTEEFKRRVQNSKNSSEGKLSVMVEAIALCAKAIELNLEMTPFDTQLTASVAMQGNVVAEMKTGEGKTLVQILSGYLNALDGDGVHIATSNDYLAERDYTDNKKVFEFLGMSVGLVKAYDSRESKQSAYDKDIVYSTIKNISFDYLRDNIVKDKKDRVNRRGYNYAVIDEVDNTLIDEATTPIILSPDEGNTEYVDRMNRDIYIDTIRRIYTEYKAGVVKEPISPEEATDIFKKNPDLDYLYCMWDRSIHLSDKHLGNDILKNCIAATYFLKNGESYLLEDKKDDKGNTIYDESGHPLKKITIIDTATGRIAASKKYTNGIQQAVEAKEAYLSHVNNRDYGVEFSNGLVALGICTYEDVLKMYKSGVSGMTGTSSELLKDIYGLDTYQVPTRKQNIRIDENRTYITAKDKYDATINEVVKNHAIGRPILIGTTSVKESQLISKLLMEKGIIHSVLNAENEALESAIIENAGQYRSVTVSTNMAGRGTDIKLSDKAKSLGGLCVIGTSRNKSERLDNQLRGRASRQGDPGSTIYFSSLEDERVTRFAGKMTHYKDHLKSHEMNEDKTVESKAVDAAQKKDEELTKSMIIDTINYNYSLVRQRKKLYKFRNMILDTDNIIELIGKILEEFINNFEDENELKDAFKDYISIDDKLSGKELSSYIYSGVMSKISVTSSMNNYQKIMKEKMLKIVDDYWVSQIQLLEIGKKMWAYEAMTARDPLEYFNIKAYKLFKIMEYNVYNEIICKAIDPNREYEVDSHSL